jgi:DNA-binding NarL/FixJ family response regulator
MCRKRWDPNDTRAPASGGWCWRWGPSGAKVSVKRVIRGMGDRGWGDSVNIVLCDPDELGTAALRDAAVRAGFEVVGEASNAIEVLQLAEHLLPRAVVIENELVGLSGLEVAADLRQLASAPQIVLVTTHAELIDDAHEAGIFLAVSRGDGPALDEAMAKLHDFLLSGERRTGVDRRSGTDRRRHQDWSQVFTERRGGGDRRIGPRRRADQGDDPSHH